MPHRLWFRLEDVLPLAEHALACPTHRLTRAQVAAGERNGPALTLTRTGHRGVLRSNGVPAWRTGDGDEQAAVSTSWCAAAASSRQEAEENLYLPLGRANLGQRRLIDVLRAARDLHRPWLAVAPDTWPGTTLDATHVQLLDRREDIAPPGVRWRPVMVTSRQVADRSYPALVADGYTANAGGLICRFDPATARLLAAETTGPWRLGTMPGEYPLLRFDGDTAVLLEERDTGEETLLDVDECCYPDRDGYYSIGAYRWSWHADTTASMPVRARLRLHLSALAARTRGIAARRPPWQSTPRPAEPSF
ncbi:hypothetical protein U2F26_31955 [Micromonospora sp. 4G57]|uniref:Uncharacterized protein n=1 Tax=Micromonospora sicca TaxID=2202420 RepID=A0ABU5JN65_9ACTN|nr:MULTISPECIES: hypothetical protein [unclassified Micromonospora]MDZ5447271.1 hypothetical protein [Micromonospora sp. 4G57]MDZ5493967.1 hypothetical protein [Micromonospora sp. 4G53]